MITVRAKLNLRRTTKGRRVIRLAEATPRPVAPARVPRISRLVALAIRFDRLLREGTVGSVSDLAALAHVTQPRATQILNLSLLAPDLIESLLTLQPVTSGRDRIHERMLRPLVALPAWREQRLRWRKELSREPVASSRSGARLDISGRRGAARCGAHLSC